MKKNKANIMTAVLLLSLFVSLYGCNSQVLTEPADDPSATTEAYTSATKTGKNSEETEAFTAEEESSSETTAEDDTDSPVDSFLKDYFHKREQDFYVDVNEDYINEQLQLEEIPLEAMRPMLMFTWAKKQDQLTIVSANIEYSVREKKSEGNILYLKVYEWTYVDYTRDMKPIDPDQSTATFGFGINHEMVLKTDGEVCILISDTYNEEDDDDALTWMSMPSSLTQEKFREWIRKDLEWIRDNSEN